MFKRNSWLSRCLTPKTGLPVSRDLERERSGLGVVGRPVGRVVLWRHVPGMFLPTPGAVVEAAVRLGRDGTLGEHVWASRRSGDGRLHRLVAGGGAAGVVDGHLSDRPGGARTAGQFHPLSAGDLVRAAVHPVDRHRHRAARVGHHLRHLFPAAGDDRRRVAAASPRT